MFDAVLITPFSPPPPTIRETLVSSMVLIGKKHLEEYMGEGAKSYTRRVG